jgi:hypothetical protein
MCYEEHDFLGATELSFVLVASGVGSIRNFKDNFDKMTM